MKTNPLKMLLLFMMALQAQGIQFNDGIAYTFL